MKYYSTIKLPMIVMLLLSLPSCITQGDKELELEDIDSGNQPQLKEQVSLSPRPMMKAKKQKLSIAQTHSKHSNGELPPVAQSGQCFEKVSIAPKTQKIIQKVMVEEEKQIISYTEPKFKMVQRDVIVKDAKEVARTIPATYKTIRAKVLSKPAEMKTVVIPAKYEYVQKRVEVKPATKEWKKTKGTDGKGEIMCLVDIPPVYKLIRKKILVTPTREVRKEVPAQYKFVDKEVIDRPMRIIKTLIPAESKKVSVKQMTEEPRKVVKVIPPKFKKVEKVVELEKGRTEWAQVLCKANTTASVVKQIQTALGERGYFSGTVNGILDEQTMRAVNKYQAKNNLPKTSGSVPTSIVESFISFDDIDAEAQYAH